MGVSSTTRRGSSSPSWFLAALWAGFALFLPIAQLVLAKEVSLRCQRGEQVGTLGCVIERTAVIGTTRVDLPVVTGTRIWVATSKMGPFPILLLQTPEEEVQLVGFHPTPEVVARMNQAVQAALAGERQSVDEWSEDPERPLFLGFAAVMFAIIGWMAWASRPRRQQPD
jgi:hypothetical protein